MKRFFFAVAFLCCAESAAAQARLPGSDGPHQQPGAELMPLVILLAHAPTWRLVEAAGFGVGAYLIIDHARREKAAADYGSQSSPAALATRYHTAGSRIKRSHRGALIHRRF